MQTQRGMLRAAFDLGITHFDLANNYRPPAGSAETNFGEHLRLDFRPYRDQLTISRKPDGTSGLAPILFSLSCRT